MEHLSWLYVHILLFACWIGGDVGVYLAMAFIKNPALSFETRATIIRLAFYIDLFPRCAFALMLPVGARLAGDLGLLPADGALLTLAWSVGLGWCALHLSALFLAGRPLARRLRQVNVGFEALMGLVFVATGAAILAGIGPAWLPAAGTAGWFGLKLLLFGVVFWVVLGIDTRFQPFTMLLQAGPGGLTAERERVITRMTNQTMAWALLLYALVLVIAFLGKVKPP
jgi:hypothetical protein